MLPGSLKYDDRNVILNRSQNSTTFYSKPTKTVNDEFCHTLTDAGYLIITILRQLHFHFEQKQQHFFRCNLKL